MGFVAHDLGVDLGTSNTLVYVRHKGIVINEPTIVVVDSTNERKVRAVGDDAKIMLGRTTDGVMAVRPMREGVITDFDMTGILIQYFMRKAIGSSYLLRPRLFLSYPCSISAIERRAVGEAAKYAGARKVYLVEKPFAAALGCGLPCYEPQGSMIVNIGGGTTEIAVISLGAAVVGKSLRIGGNALDAAIAAYVKKEKNLLIGDRTAEDVKIDLGSAVAPAETQKAMMRGRDVVTGLPRTASLDTDEVYEVLQEPLREIMSAILWVLERTPPELGADVMRSGIYLTGGVSQLTGMDQFIAAETGIPVQVARNPLDCAALGAGYLASNLELLSRIGKNHPLTE